MIFQPIVNLTQICYELGVRKVISCPGSRSAPLTLAFARNPNLELLSINDERSAGFIGLGMALGSRRPVVIVSTSGSAVYNLAPAVAEAYYQHVALVLFTADRPPEWTDQWDGQTIRQDHIYGDHVKGFFKLPTDLDNAESAWQVERMVSKAVNLSSHPAAGPVHINCPFREPFYPTKEEQFVPSPNVKVVSSEIGRPGAQSLNWKALTGDWNQSQSKLIVMGQNPADTELSKAISLFSEKYKLPVVADILSNQILGANRILLYDSFLIQANGQAHQFRPNLLITLGKSVVSKNLKLLLRNLPPEHHWHIGEYPEFADPFKSLTRSISASPVGFLTMINSRMDTGQNQNQYLGIWKHANQSIRQMQVDFFPSQPFSEFHAVQILLPNLVSNSNLHLGNSMAIRYANLLASWSTESDVQFFGNRGTSGIDGCLSTAVGDALSTKRTVILLVGDVSFFYDRNALWHRHKPDNLKIIILANQGGGIFRLIEGPSSQPELDDYFVGTQSLNAKRTAEDYQLPYIECDSAENLNEALPRFLEPNSGAGILEVTTDAAINTTVFHQYKTLIQKSYEA